ncbi:MAG: ABC transporter ATP-binding protein [Alphaproteobacteria bacterium]|nr:ABC transporter ATP-binding protein [Alphaproteobacteria bacterium]
MSALALAEVSLALGSFTLGEISFTLEGPEILVVLGPNGAGKSVLLETIAGFHRPACGRIIIGDRDVTALPPERRRVGFLVQNFGLFPHLTIVQNVALAARGASSDGAAPAIGELLARFGIAHLAEASPLVLSPGEKQRVALARAQACRPDVFLLDEPFAALDAPARDELRLELLRFLRAARIPALFVTHDHTDVAALGDRVAIMREGRILQLAASSEVFHRPLSRTVAEIVGIENILAGRITSRDPRGLRVAVGGQIFWAVGDGPGGSEVDLAVRADAIRLVATDDSAVAAENRIPATVVALHNLGVLTKVTLDAGIRLIACLMTRDAAELGLAPGAAIVALIRAADVHPLVP